jgi:cation diffusion facilitator CzcD-associated flavoprotein CzcO
MEHFDVLVVGAGISGIGAGYHLQTRCPNKTYAIFESRSAIGGTWDLFRYPGIRSDSDMYTLGFSFRPWTEAKSIADGPAILKYLRETAESFGIDRHILFERRVIAAAWDSAASLWTVDYEEGPDRRPAQATCRFLHMCAGY